MAKDVALWELLSSFPAITAEVGDRISPIIRPQGSSTPAITYRRVSSPRYYDFDGIIMVDQNYDLHIYAQSYSKLQEISHLLEDNLTGVSGTFGNEIIEHISIQEIGNDDYLEEEEIYTDSVEIKIRFKGE